MFVVIREMLIFLLSLTNLPFIAVRMIKSLGDRFLLVAVLFGVVHGSFYNKRDCAHTSITASKSASSVFETTKTYDWGLTKTLVSANSSTLGTNACFTSQYTVNAKRTIVSQTSSKYLRGNVTVCNQGAYPTENLQINDVIQLKCWVAPQAATTATAVCTGNSFYGQYSNQWTDSNHVYPIDLGTKTSLAPSECYTWSYQLDLSLILYSYVTTTVYEGSTSYVLHTYPVTDNICGILSTKIEPDGERKWVCTDCDQYPLCLLNNTARVTITNYINYVPGCTTTCGRSARHSRQAPPPTDTSLTETTETSGDTLNTEAPPTTGGGTGIDFTETTIGGGGDNDFTETTPPPPTDATDPPSIEFTFPPTSPPTSPPTPCISNCPGPELCPYGPGYGLGGVSAYLGGFPLTPTSLTEINEKAQIADNSITGAGLTCTQMPGGNIVIPDPDLCVAPTPNDMNCTLFADCCNTAMTCDTYSTYKDFVQLSVVDETAQLSRYSNHAGPIEVYSGTCPQTGCTLSIGYWKTHAGYTGKNADRITQYLPLTIGCPPAQYAKGANVTSATQAVSILSFNALLGGASNGLNKLAGQLLAAKLNILNGAAHSGSFDATVTTANNYLCSYGFNPGSWNSLSNSIKNSINTVKDTLDQYNNGILAGEPSHCESKK